MLRNISWRRWLSASFLSILAMGLGVGWPPSAAASETGASAGELALMPPGRIAFESRDLASLPQLLSPGDALLYRKMFEAIQRGELTRAEHMAPSVRDTTYLPSVTAARLLRTLRPAPDDVLKWLKANPNHPAAPRMLALAQRVTPPKTRLPAIPNGGGLRLGEIDVPWIDRPVHPQARGKTGLRRLAAIRKAIRQGKSQAAITLCDSGLDRDFSPLDADALRAEVAMALLSQGRPAQAFAMARPAAQRSARDVPLAAQVLGLAAWSMSRFDEAAAAFETVATAPAAANWTRAAGAFWAARALRRKGQNQAAEAWLTRAASEPRSFYGQIARRALGMGHGLDLELPHLDERALTRLRAHPGAVRALMALQIGRPAEAEAELIRAFQRAEPSFQPVLLAVAERAGLAPLAMRMASLIRERTGRRYDAGFYPIPHWTLPAGYAVSPALLYAIARQETLFDPLSRSRAGAAGILQLMPDTAREMSGGAIALRRGEAVGPQLEADTGLTVELGQRLVAVLLDHDKIQGDVVRMAIAYNAGPGNLSKWSERPGMKGDDPLLTVELLPFVETRLFAQRTLYNFWVYQARLGHPQPTLEALAHGRRPRYDPAVNWSHDLAQVRSASR